MRSFPRLTGLVAASHSPFHQDGSLNLDVISAQAEGLLSNDVTCAFVCGTTGESTSLTLNERLAITQRWAEVTRKSSLDVIAHVGANCLQDAIDLAAAAGKAGVQGCAALAPSYFKPATIEDLTEFLIPIAAAAPEIPFYFYDIPTMTNVTLPMVRFLEYAGPRIPNLAGLKYTNGDAIQMQECLRLQEGRFEILHGFDETLLSGLALGARGAVGSSYNFAAPIYHRVIAAFERGDFETARREQAESVRLIRLLCRFGYLSAAKVVMELLGVPVGPSRSPLRPLNHDERASLESALHAENFWEQIQPERLLASRSA